MMTVYDHLAEFAGDDARRLEAIFEAFEKAWLAGQAPRIADYLPEEGPLRRASLIELIFIDQEYAIQFHSAAKVEDYLGEFPELETDPDLFFDLVTREFRLRVRRGESPSTEEYLNRFPHLGNRIEDRLKAEALPPPSPPGESTTDLAPADPLQGAEPTALPNEEDPRYDQLQFHARGGLGDVYRGRDVELSREVALKRIRLEYSSESRVRRRFLREARLTARLSHPGVVPIHGLIWDRHGQPWYVMRFVEGRTLARAIDDYHDPSVTAPDDRPLAFRELLSRFVAVCDAIAFAHSRDVVHRDLKPANVILGEYGETIVLDWGLATTTLTPLADQPPDQPAPTLDHEAEPLTHDGHVLGTPAYMSPEQAKGLTSMNRPASDIYGLGAILYKILAGRSTFEGQSWPSFREKIILGHYPTPRQLKPEVPRPLEAICRKAMALEPAQRYETARDLARDLERWLADEPVTAHREPWTLRAGRWARKHRTAVTTAASTALVAAFLIGLFAETIRAWTRRADADGQATLARVESLEAEARGNPEPDRWSEAIAEARRARSQLESGGGSDGLKTRARVKLAGLEEALRVVQRDRQMVNALDEARLRGADIKDGKFDFDAMTDAILAAFRSHGIDLASLAIEDAAARIRSSRIAAELVTALDEAISAATPAIRERLAAVARRADPEGAQIRERIVRKDFDGLRHLVDNEAGRLKWGARCRTIFDALATLDPTASLPLLEAIHGQHRTDFWLNLNLAIACRRANPPRPELAIRYLYAAAAIKPTSPGVFTTLGNALRSKGELDAAIVAQREAIRLKPDEAVAHCNLGVALHDKGEWDAAIVAQREAIRLKSSLAEAHNSLGAALYSKGELDAAIAEYREAIRLKTDYALAHYNLGDALYAKGELDAAIVADREAIRLEPGLAEAHSNLGNALQSKGELNAAIAEFREAIRLKTDYAAAHYNLGNALKSKGELDAAIAEYREAIRLKPGHAEAHSNLGNALGSKGEGDAAIVAHREAIRLKPGLAEAHSNLGNALRSKGELDAAIAEYREAIRLRPGFAEAHCNLGQVLEAQGRFEEALGYRERGHELGSRTKGWRHPSAQWVRNCRRMIELEAKLPAVLRGDSPPIGPGERLELAFLCYHKAQYATSTRFYGQAFADQPRLAENLGLGHRYNAACAASLAGSEVGKDDPPPDDSERASFREQALGWLRADLEIWAKVLEGGNAKGRQAIVQTLAHWKTDRDLAGIRDEASLAKFAEAEREAFQSLWADVEALQKKAAGAGSPP